MEDWSYRLKMLWSEWKSEIIQFGFGLLFLWAALRKGNYILALLIIAGVLIWYACQRWGKKYQELGAYLMSKEYRERKKSNKSGTETNSNRNRASRNTTTMDKRSTE